VQDVKGSMAVVGKGFVVLIGGVMRADTRAHNLEPGVAGTTAAPGDSMMARPFTPQRRTEAF
jgi:hypothetical protein